jgi:hypothetical protein
MVLRWSFASEKGTCKLIKKNVRSMSIIRQLTVAKGSASVHLDRSFGASERTVLLAIGLIDRSKWTNAEQRGRTQEAQVYRTGVPINDKAWPIVCPASPWTFTRTRRGHRGQQRNSQWSRDTTRSKRAIDNQQADCYKRGASNLKERVCVSSTPKERMNVVNRE